VLSRLVAPATPIDEIVVDPARQVGEVPPFIYGQFLEHIYNSVVDGLWGQLVRGPSFEEAPSTVPEGWTLVNGSWNIEGDEIFVTRPQSDAHILCGDPGWGDYTFAVQAMKKGGPEGFLILFRATDENNFCWWNLGGWGNTGSAVERETNGGRRPLRETRTETIIESGRWYQIEVQVADSRVACFLDGERLCSFEDAELGRGRIGLGSWSTEVRYRNVRVTRGDETLYVLQPRPVEPKDTISSMWYKRSPHDDDLQCTWASDDPLNGDYCQRVHAGPTGGGIAQQGFSVQGGIDYLGAVWLRGNGSVAVALTAGDTKQERQFEVRESAWVKYPLAFCPGQSAADGELSITLEGEGEVWIDQCTLSRADTPYRPAVFERVKAIRPTFIRWPGGCYAEYYRWKDGIGGLKDRVTKPNYVWGGLDPNHFGTLEFLKLCEDVGAEPVIVINIGHHEPADALGDYIQEALDWFEYCSGGTDTQYGALRAAHGYPERYRVTYWEIGNETWGMGVEHYAERARQFVDTLRARDPSLRFLVCGSAGHDLEWNRRVLELAATHMDYLSVHHYMAGSFEAEMNDGAAYPEFLRKTGELIRKSANPAIKIAVTEWNQQSISLRTGLYAGMVLNGFERYSDAIAMSCPALFIRKTTAPAWNNAFINHDAHRSFVAPNYVVMKLYRDNYAPALIHVEAPETLNVVATYDSGAEECILKIVNSSATDEVCARLRVGDKYVRGFTQWRVWHADVNAENSIEDPDNIRAQRAVIDSDAASFPAHSATVIRFAASQ